MFCCWYCCTFIVALCLLIDDVAFYCLNCWELYLDCILVGFGLMWLVCLFGFVVVLFLFAFVLASTLYVVCCSLDFMF